MKSIHLLAVLVLLGLALTPAQSMSFTETDNSAQLVAETFLELLDDHEFPLAWGQTSIVNQSYSDPPEWFAKILAVRPHLGPVSGRALKTMSQHQSWVGLPDGEYLRLSYSTVFAHKKESLETVVLVREGNNWFISAYHLR
jgi:hypothetical protein